MEWFLFLGALLVVLTLFLRLRRLRSKETKDQRVVKENRESEPTELPTKDSTKCDVGVFFATTKGTSRQLAHKLFNFLTLGEPKLVVEVMNLENFEPESLAKQRFAVFIVPTYEGGKPPKSAQMFTHLLEEMSTDFRFGPAFLADLRFCVFGLGDKAYGPERFCQFAKHLTGLIRQLGGKSASPPVNATESQVTALFPVFTQNVLRGVRKTQLGAQAQPLKTAADPVGAHDDTDEEQDSEVDDAPNEMEDLAGQQHLLYPRLEKNLTKQGYQIIGSHSGVKLCRWTKSMLRGRGGCYKHTFYNISSFQCMEMTPSLACANKCVFCWRHHTNPVAKGFTWEMDPPEFLVEEALKKHRAMIKQMKGVPGVQPERLEEAMRIRHCALSLVGEPIIYPEINRFVGLLHGHRISTFMVTNSQFPDRVKQLAPVTQLYCSVDAPTPEELKRVDRPIFDDYWERCVECIKELANKPQRTVFRLTLVKGFNTDHVDRYASLVYLGNPDFIEVKGVTFCGDTKTGALTMQNVPYHTEVVAFCEQMAAAVNRFGAAPAAGLAVEVDPIVRRELQASATTKPRATYRVACEHEHSCCVLIAKETFRINDQWHTWIDYDRFFELIESGRTDFDSLEYAAATPSWATYQSTEKGFDPKEARVHRKTTN